MAYSKTTWKDNEAPYLNASNLNKIENGIDTNDAQIVENTAQLEQNTTDIADNRTDIDINSDNILGLSVGEVYQGSWTPEAGTEYPAGALAGYSYYITGLDDNGYTFTGGDLTGRVANNSDKMIYNGTSWSMIDNTNEMLGYYLVDDIESMLALSPLQGALCQVYGYYSANDGGGGKFNYDASYSGVNNGGTILNGWVRQYDGALNVKWFGAVGDGVTDDTLAIQETLDTAFDLSENVFVSRGKYLISSQLTIQREISVFGEDKYNTKIMTATPSINVLYVTGIYLGTISKLSIVSDADDVIGIYLDTVTRADITECEFLGCRYSWYAVDGGHHNYSFITSRASGTQESGGFWMGSSQGGYDGTVEGETEGAGNYGAVVCTITSCSFQVESVEGRPEYIKLKRNANLLISNSEFIAVNSTCNGITLHDDAQGIHINNCAINGWSIGILTEIGTYVDEHNRAPRVVTLTSSEFDQNIVGSLHILDGESIIMNGCTISSSNKGIASTPIYCGDGTVKAKITSSMITGYSGTGAKAIHLDGSDLVTIQDNDFSGCAVCIQFDNLPTLSVVRDNDFSRSNPTKIGGDPSGSTNAIGNNHGMPIKNISATDVGAGVDITNDSGYDCVLFLDFASNEDVAGLVWNGSTIELDRHSQTPLRAGTTYQIQYSTPPTRLRWFANVSS